MTLVKADAGGTLCGCGAIKSPRWASCRRCRRGILLDRVFEQKTEVDEVLAALARAKALPLAYQRSR